MVQSDSQQHSSIRQERLASFFFPIDFSLPFHLAKKVVRFAFSADGTTWAVVNEKISRCWTRWEAVEVEKKSSPVAFAIQMEVAETMETVRMD